MFLIQQLKGLDDPTSPSFKRYFYLLEVCNRSVALLFLHVLPLDINACSQ